MKTTGQRCTSGEEGRPRICLGREPRADEGGGVTTSGTPRGGRPPNELLTDPDRYAVAFARALIEIGMSKRAAFDLAAGLFSGREGAPPGRLQLLSRTPAA